MLLLSCCFWLRQKDLVRARKDTICFVPHFDQRLYPIDKNSYIAVLNYSVGSVRISSHDEDGP